jgi:hypothetical protein
MSAESSTATFVSPQRLCIGLHVHLDLPWTEHPFTFSSFKIKSLEQIAALQSLGLQRIRYTAAKSDSEPLAEPAKPQAASPSTAPSDEIRRAKLERVERLAAQRKRAEACEREFASSTKAVKTINQNVFAQPALARQEAGRLVQAIADSMLLDADIAINLMKEKIGGETSTATR